MAAKWDDLIKDVERLHLGPGDKLVVTANRPITQEQADRIKRALGVMLQVPIVVITDDLVLSVVHTEDSQEPDAQG